jgi:glycine cleavage system aminomethyltransferase T
MSDYRIEAATKEEWANRALVAEAKLDKAGTAALETILNERGPVFDAMVDAAEDAAGKDVSFNVVVGRAIRAALTALAELEGEEEAADTAWRGRE